MPVKISKVAKDLNVGFQTLVDFLAKKKIIIDSNPNTRISDEQYQMLLNEFKSDKAQRIKSDQILNERKQEKAKTSAKDAAEDAKEEVKKEPATEGKSLLSKIGLKIVGKISIDKNKGQAAKPEPEATKIEEGTQIVPQPEPEVKPEVKAEVKEEVSADKTTDKTSDSTPDIVTEQTVIAAPEPREETITEEETTHVDEKEPQEVAAKEETVKEETVVKEPQAKEVKVETAPAPAPKETLTTGQPGASIKVVGKIDLAAINQQTRPKKKTKEEKRREYIDKAHNTNAANGEAAPSGDRKKRKRIGKEKIDIEKSSTQLQDGSRPADRNTGSRDKDKGKSHSKAKRAIKPEVSEEEVQKQVKETLARLTSKTVKKSAKWRREKREDVREREREAAELEAAEEKVLKLTEFVTANDLAIMMDVPINKVIGTCMSLGVMVSINQRLDAETINIVAEEFGFKTEFVSAEVVEAINEEEDNEEDLVPRPPVVTVMGHVDHGKTSLLDYIRNSNVIAGEAGGITQHIGAYNVTLKNGQHITFLDTPGHEAFTAMRARGAKVTDIAIIIVAADDDIMPQTIEAINHASAAGVPMIFAINKIDKPAANPEKIKEGLANMNYLVEDWGGKYQSQDISAKKGMGVTELLDKILLEAEMLELKANPNRRATGSVIESSLDKGRGYVATVLVQNGTLHVGDIVLAGTHYGKVKAMFNERNQRIPEAGPASPALILGLNGAPTAGDTFNVMATEQEAREISSKREQLQRELGLRTQKRVTLEDIGRRKALGSFNELNIIVKGDVDGSIEALSDSLIKLSTPEVQVNVLHKAVGAVSESDVVLASASDAFILGFQVRPSQAARRLAEKEGVDIRIYSIIYQAIEDVKNAMEGMLSPEIKEEILGMAEVLQTYHISKVGTIAGAMVREGKVKRNCKVRLIRDGIVRYTGELGSLKRFKDDAKEVLAGFDCGLSISGYNDIVEGDIIESFEEVEVKKSLN